MTEESPGFDLDDVVRLPPPGLDHPGSFSFSPSGRWLAWLHDPGGGLELSLFARDLETHETLTVMTPAGGGTTDDNVLAEEALRRERARERATGVTSYRWAEKADVLVIPVGGDVFVVDAPGSSTRLLLDSSDGAVLDPTPSADGKRVAFVRDGEVQVAPASGGSPSRLTTGAKPAGVTNGLAEYVAHEEFGRDRGFWWSPDGAWIAFLQVDQKHIPEFAIQHLTSASSGPPPTETHRYPFPGEPNARARLGFARVSDGGVAWSDLHVADDGYIAAAEWDDTGTFLVQSPDRRQKTMTVLAFTPEAADKEVTGSVVIEDTVEPWVNLHDALHRLGEDRWLWASERSGHRHLEVREGEDIRSLSIGDWDIVTVHGVDRVRGTVLCTSTIAGPRERQLMELPLDGGSIRVHTSAPGTHRCVVDVERRRFVDLHSECNVAPSVMLGSLDDTADRTILWSTEDDRLEQIPLPAPEFRTVPVTVGSQVVGSQAVGNPEDQPEGALLLDGLLYRPDGEGPWPLVVDVYGGPHVQRAVDTWSVTASMRAQWLRDRGVAVWALDNRGSAGRGLAFEAPIAGRLGTVEVEDQVAGVRSLVEAGIADPDRVAVVGWSYGGYMALRLLALAPEVFCAAVAGAPVTEWEGYDTAYTERYMGLPAENPDGYREASVITHIGGIRGRLLIVHGMLDENVHFRHTARLVAALQNAGIAHDLMALPGDRHMPRLPAARRHLEERVTSFLLDALGAPAG